MSLYNFTPVFTLKAVREKSIRWSPKVHSAEPAAAILRAYLHEKDCEHLVVLMLDNAHNFLGLAVVAQGGITGLHVTAREVFKHAIIHRAHAIILGHNHPSSDTTPSMDDITFTQKVAEIGSVMGCPLLDHIVVSSGIKEGWRSIWKQT